MDTLNKTSPTPSATRVPGQRNVVDTAAENGSFKVFGKALRQSGMVETLRGEGPFTVFAPTDAAFDQLPAGKLDNWLKPENKEELISVLEYHVVRGRSSAADVAKLSEAKTVNGQAAPIVASGTKLSFDGAELVARDIASSNGMLHGIDKVNIPTQR